MICTCGKHIFTVCVEAIKYFMQLLEAKKKIQANLPVQPLLIRDCLMSGTTFRASSSYFFLFFPIFWRASYFLLFLEEFAIFSFFLRVLLVAWKHFEIFEIKLINAKKK